MNIYEEQCLEQKLDEITSHIGHLILDIILTSVKMAAREYQTYGDWEDSRRDVTSNRNDPF
ncbi:MAG: hypothetical protein ED859_12180 [Desulfuromonadales bacterium]|nr:MAG: hypothetical protein ED859_12180 [Desulfuromonadales bacterium]